MASFFSRLSPLAFGVYLFPAFPSYCSPVAGKIVDFLKASCRKFFPLLIKSHKKQVGDKWFRANEKNMRLKMKSISSSAPSEKKSPEKSLFALANF